VRVVKPDRIVVANDRIAANSWERKFYTASVPRHLKVSFFTLEDVARELLNNLFKNESVLLLFESVRDAYEVVEKGVTFEEINLGGLHHREGAEELLPYLFVTEEDRRLLRELVKRGITLMAQDLPGNTKKIVNSLVV